MKLTVEKMIHRMNLMKKLMTLKPIQKAIRKVFSLIFFSQYLHHVCSDEQSMEEDRTNTNVCLVLQTLDMYEYSPTFNYMNHQSNKSGKNSLKTD